MTTVVTPAQTMSSFQSIVSNASLSDNSYIYAKSGSVKTEGFGHYFTRCSVRASTVTQLENAIRSQCGSAIGNSVAPLLNPFRKGSQQMKVKDLRAVFEKVKALQLASAYGKEFSSAFVAPLKNHRPGPTVTAAETVMDHLVQHQEKWKPLLEGKTARVGETLGKFIATEQNRTSLQSVLQEQCHLSDAEAQALMPAGKGRLRLSAVIESISKAFEKLDEKLEAAIEAKLQDKAQLQWSDEQKQNFRAAAHFMQDAFPAQNLNDLLTELTYIAGARMGFPSLAGQSNPLALTKAFALCGCAGYALIGEKSAALSALPPEAGVRDFYNVLFGDETALPQGSECQTITTIQQRAGRHLEKLWLEALFEAKPAYRDWFSQCLKIAKKRNPAATPETLHDEAISMFSRQPEIFATNVWDNLGQGQTSGFMLKNQLKHMADKQLPFTQDDLALKPFIDIRAAGGTMEKIKQLWEGDFPRQGTEDGRTCINISLPDSKVSVDNQTEDVSNNDAKQEFAHKYEQVYNGLQALCGKNDRQMMGALTALCQCGIASLNRTAGFLGIEAGQEHSPLIYDISKDNNGDLLIVTRSPNETEAPKSASRYAKQEARTIVHQNGLIEIVSFKLTPPAHPAAAQSGEE